MEPSRSQLLNAGNRPLPTGRHGSTAAGVHRSHRCLSITTTSPTPDRTRSRGCQP